MKGKGAINTFWLIGEMSEENPDFAPPDMININDSIHKGRLLQNGHVGKN